MTTKHKHDNPILVTGAAGAVDGIGRNLTELLLARGHKVRALVRREDERAEARSDSSSSTRETSARGVRVCVTARFS
jgi:NAD(P)-dependent dehydrogenase (short-subunit alcohol dehydrogenase family)